MARLTREDREIETQMISLPPKARDTPTPAHYQSRKHHKGLRLRNMKRNKSAKRRQNPVSREKEE